MNRSVMLQKGRLKMKKHLVGFRRVGHFVINDQLLIQSHSKL